VGSTDEKNVFYFVLREKSEVFPSKSKIMEGTARARGAPVLTPAEREPQGKILFLPAERISLLKRASVIKKP